MGADRRQFSEPAAAEPAATTAESLWSASEARSLRPTATSPWWARVGIQTAKGTKVMECKSPQERRSPRAAQETSPLPGPADKATPTIQAYSLAERSLAAAGIFRSQDMAAVELETCSAAETPASRFRAARSTPPERAALPSMVR